MVGLVETMVKLHRDLPKAKTPHERKTMRRQVAATNRQIDGLVYELHGLTEDEIRNVGAVRDDSRNNTGCVPDYRRLSPGGPDDP